jgi:NarL family two-component system response regulator YdfI
MSNMNNAIRVVIVDDHPIVREGLRMMLELAGGFDLVGEAPSGALALRLIEDQQPDVVLVDLRLPDIDGLEIIDHIHRAWPQIALLILTTYDEDRLMIQGLRAGASGYLLKDVDIAILLDAIRTVARGDLLIQPEALARILDHAAQSVSALPPGVFQENLTEREIEVLSAIIHGDRTKEIAIRLHIAERTVRAHLTSIYTKLGVDSRASAVAVALERGLLPY